MNAVQGTRSVSASVEEEDVSVKASKSVAKKIKQSQPKESTDVVFVCLDADFPRFDLILDQDSKIRGVRNPAGHLLFKVPKEDADRVRKHHHITTGRLVEA